MRLLLLLLVPVMLLGGCTDRVLQYDASRPPLDIKTQIPILPDFPGEYPRPNRFVYGDAVENPAIQQEGTIELSNSLFARDQNEDDECDDSFANGATCTVCYLVCAPLGFAAALVILPVLIAKGGMHGDQKEETVSSRQQHAEWLAGVVDNQKWAKELDAAYISGLTQALGWKAPEGPPQTPSFWSVPNQNTFYARISKIVLVDTDSGEHILLLCARSSIHQGWGTTARTIQTCQRGNMAPGNLADSPDSADALRATLLERARQLSAVQARELCPPCISQQ